MKRDEGVVIVAVLATLMASPPAFAQQCPPEVAAAKAKIALLKTAQASAVEAPRTLAGARMPEVQAPRGQEQQAPRGQEQQAPRGQDVQAPRMAAAAAARGQEVQAPRGQEQQAPRGQDIQAPRAAAGARAKDGVKVKIAEAEKLVSEAEEQCRAGNMTVASEKARAALATLE